jgi:hypothetical protein
MPATMARPYETQDLAPGSCNLPPRLAANAHSQPPLALLRPIQSRSGVEHVSALLPKAGFLRDYVQYCLPMTDAPPLFHLAAGLVLAGHTLAQSVQLRHGVDWLYPNLWIGLGSKVGRIRRLPRPWTGW